MIVLGVALLVLLAIAGTPLFAVLLGAAMLGFYSADIDLAIIAIELYRIVDTPLLVALPLFTFSGYLLSAAKTSERLVDLVQSMFGWLPSGLAIVGFVTCAVFTALTGASGVTIVALGALLLPALKQAGFSERQHGFDYIIGQFGFAFGAVCAAYFVRHHCPADRGG